MAKKHSDDYIKTEADYVAQHEAMKEWQETHPDPRHKYSISFVYDGKPMTQEVWEMNAEEAEKHFRSEWSKVGVYFKDLTVVGD